MELALILFFPVIFHPPFNFLLILRNGFTENRGRNIYGHPNNYGNCSVFHNGNASHKFHSLKKNETSEEQINSKN